MLSGGPAGREGRRLSREAAARISALRDKNYEEYLRLARTTKDKRLRTLMDKTDSIISELGLKVFLSSVPSIACQNMLTSNLDINDINIASACCKCQLIDLHCTEFEHSSAAVLMVSHNKHYLLWALYGLLMMRSGASLKIPTLSPRTWTCCR